ncbi:hypothetical protein RFI_11720 [Reticulomyxa filosa]|uniref:Uncharacterized protein n=1 Tax=Reticulomyxa filosa TaxID=46433 RepID=X6NHR1_RETFI|nr:hypothetical protein RFI_11720 [Reticulomyxa filosa]|eukprot:ETO25418.1 hypothetical protein RFI_11720 [Reticulomyxa filosa]
MDLASTSECDCDDCDTPFHVKKKRKRYHLGEVSSTIELPSLKEQFVDSDDMFQNANCNTKVNLMDEIFSTNQKCECLAHDSDSLFTFEFLSESSYCVDRDQDVQQLFANSDFMTHGGPKGTNKLLSENNKSMANQINFLKRKALFAEEYTKYLLHQIKTMENLKKTLTRENEELSVIKKRLISPVLLSTQTNTKKKKVKLQLSHYKIRSLENENWHIREAVSLKAKKNINKNDLRLNEGMIKSIEKESSLRPTTQVCEDVFKENTTTAEQLKVCPL